MACDLTNNEKFNYFNIKSNYISRFKHEISTSPTGRIHKCWCIFLYLMMQFTFGSFEIEIHIKKPNI